MKPDNTYSVVVPVYDRAPELLGAALQSVADASRLTPSSIEIIVVDDGSKLPVLDEFVPRSLSESPVRRIRVLRAQQNRGIAAARNLGIRNARHEWIVLLDSDDVLTPNFFRAVDSHIAGENEAARFLFTDHEKRDYSLEHLIERRQKHTYYRLLRDHAGTLLDPFLHHTFLIHCHVIHRSVFEVAGLFDETIDFGDEIDFHLRCTSRLPHTAFRHIPEVLYVYRDNPDGVCGNAEQYARLIRNIEQILLTWYRARGGVAISCHRAGKEPDGAVAYLYERTSREVLS